MRYVVILVLAGAAELLLLSVLPPDRREEGRAADSHTHEVLSPNKEAVYLAAALRGRRIPAMQSRADLLHWLRTTTAELKGQNDALDVIDAKAVLARLQHRREARPPDIERPPAYVLDRMRRALTDAHDAVIRLLATPNAAGHFWLSPRDQHVPDGVPVFLDSRVPGSEDSYRQRSQAILREVLDRLPRAIDWSDADGWCEDIGHLIDRAFPAEVVPIILGTTPLPDDLAWGVFLARVQSR